MLSRSEDLLFVWGPAELVLSLHVHPVFENGGRKILVKNLLWWVRKFRFQRGVVLQGGTIFKGYRTFLGKIEKFKVADKLLTIFYFSA